MSLSNPPGIIRIIVLKDDTVTVQLLLEDRHLLVRDSTLLQTVEEGRDKEPLGISKHLPKVWFIRLVFLHNTYRIYVRLPLETKGGEGGINHPLPLQST